MTIRKEFTDYATYMALPKHERDLIRRSAFGHPDPAVRGVLSDADKQRVRAMLEKANDETGWFPGKWTDEEDLEGMEDLL